MRKRDTDRKKGREGETDRKTCKEREGLAERDYQRERERFMHMQRESEREIEKERFMHSREREKDCNFYIPLKHYRKVVIIISFFFPLLRRLQFKRRF